MATQAVSRSNAQNTHASGSEFPDQAASPVLIVVPAPLSWLSEEAGPDEVSEAWARNGGQGP